MLLITQKDLGGGLELIVTQWDVNYALYKLSLRYILELIVTQWDVNVLKRLKVLRKVEELIVTQWDVN